MNYLRLVPWFTLAYLVLLFLIAYFSDKLKERGRNLAANPYIYSLSLTVYCTAWTFFGSVGLFTHHGFEYITVYIGATFAAFTWWHTLKKIITISRRHNTTSIADFISTRYGKSHSLGALVTVLVLIGILPYIALQLKAIDNTLGLLFFYDKAPESAGIAIVTGDVSFYIALIISVFGALFGARKLDVTERHEGMVVAIAFESIVKLVAILAVGIYVTYFVYDGYSDIFTQAGYYKDIAALFVIGGESTPSYFQWFNLILLSGVAVMLLPRQFHVAVIENQDINHVKKAMFLFPLYLFLVNFFVPAIALGGRLMGLPVSEADRYMLQIPIMKGNEPLALLVFVGGFSAATGMLIVESVAISTLVLNHVISPAILRLKLARIDLSYLLIHLKRLIILLIMLLGYAYFKVIGETKILVDIGLMSFCAILQLGPATFLGIYWERSNRIGAIAGITAGMSVWFYTLFIPSLKDALPFFRDISTNGLFGLSTLRPDALFHLSGLDTWSHSMFWSLLLNSMLLVAASIIFKNTEAEKEIAVNFVNVYRADMIQPGLELKKHITHAPSVSEYRQFVAKFTGLAAADKAIGTFIEENRITDTTRLSSPQNLALRTTVEKTLSAYFGAATARNIVDKYLNLYGTKVVDMFDIFYDISENLKESRETLAIRLKELTLMYDCLETLMSTVEEDRIMGSVIDILIRSFNFDGCAVVLVDSDGVLRIRKHEGLPQDLVNSVIFDSAPTTYVGKSFGESSIVQVEDIHESTIPLKLRQLADGSPVLSLAAAPIIVAGKPLGVVVILNKTKQMFSDQFISFFQGISNQLGLALKNAQLYRELTELNLALEQKVRDRTVELENKSLLLEDAYNHLQEVDRLKSQFLSTMSHELRTPLNSIIGYTDLILDGVDGETSTEQADDLVRIKRNARHLLQLINDILDLSKIEAGRMELKITKFNFSEALEQAMTIVTPLTADRRVTFNKEVLQPVYIVGDRQRVEQILINLLSNAVKFTDSGSITIGILTQSDQYGKQWAEIYIRDTGIGIAKENLDKIFEAFRQVEDTTTRKYGGTGLGLSITKKLIEMQGGSIWVESEPGAGTTMTFTLPVAGAAESVTPYTKDISLIATGRDVPGASLTVFVDLEDRMQILYDRLSRGNFSITITPRNEALLKIAEISPAFAVYDITDNQAEANIIVSRLRESGMADLPVILVSFDDAGTGIKATVAECGAVSADSVTRGVSEICALLEQPAKAAETQGQTERETNG